MALVTGFCGISFGASADAPVTTYRSTVSEVRLTFFSSDEQNHNVDTLEPQDFAVVDDERIVRNFRSFHRLDETKLEVIVMVDSSESVSSHFKEEISNALGLISQTDWLSTDQISVVSFGGAQPQVICSGDCRTSPAMRQLFTARPSGLTPLFDGVVFAADRLSEYRDPSARPVIILFSDGEDTFSRNGSTTAIQAALANDAQIYAVDVNNPKHVSGGSDTLRQMARATGGRYFSIRDGAVKVLGTVLEDLHAAYVVTYDIPSHSAGLHTVHILPTHNQNLQFRCRYGYYYRDKVQ